MCTAIAKVGSFHRFLLSTGLLVLVTLALAPAALGQSARKQSGVAQAFNQITERHFQSETTVLVGVNDLASLDMNSIVDPNALQLNETSDSKSKSSKSKQREQDEKEKSSKKDDDDDDDDEKEKSSKKADKLAKAKQQDDDDDDSNDDDDDDDDTNGKAVKVKDKSAKKSKKDQARSKSSNPADASVLKLQSEVEATPFPETQQATATQKSLSAKASYITLADALKRAQAAGGSGEVLQVDLEWDEARSTVTWDLTFASGTEYEVDALSGKFLGEKIKGTSKLAQFAPLALDDRGMLTFQEIIRKAEAERGQSVMEMELKHAKGSQEAKFEVVLADRTTLFYAATTGKALTGK